jgi:hypothetical protein
VKYTSDYYLHDFSAHKVQNASQIFDNLWNFPVDETQVQYLRLQRIRGFLLGGIPKVTKILSPLDCWNFQKVSGCKQDEHARDILPWLQQ